MSTLARHVAESPRAGQGSGGRHRGAEAVCLLAGVLTPLAFHTLGTLGFEAAKATLIWLLALVLVLGWAAGRAGNRRWPIGSGDLGRVTGLPRLAAFAVAGYMGALLVAAGFSIAPGASIWGSYDRLQGLLTTLAWIALGVAAAVAGRVGERRWLMVRVWLVTSLPICLYGLAQRFRLDPIDWLNQPIGVTSTLGSSTALGTYLAMLLPLTLVLAVDSAEGLLDPRGVRRGRPGSGCLRRVPYTGWVTLAALHVVVLLLTEVRGAAVGALMGIGLAVVAIGWQRFGRDATPVILVGAGVLVGGIAAHGAWVEQRAGGLEESSVRQRLLIWGATLETVASGGWRGLVGFGSETQALALEARFPAALAARYPDARFDRAHNLVLDALLTTGLLGLAASAVLIWALGRCGLSALKLSGRDGLLAAGLVGALGANLTAGLYAFDSIATGALFWLLAGLLVAPLCPASMPEPAARAASARTARPDRCGPLTVPSARLRATSTLAAFAIGATAVPTMVGPLIADLYYTRGLALRAGEAPAQSITELLNATGWAPNQDVYYLALGRAYQEVASTTAARESPVPATFDDLAAFTPTGRDGLFAAARLALERGVDVNPRDPYSYLHLARFWALWGDVDRGSNERMARLGRAADAYDTAIALSPNRATFYDEAGLAYLQLGHADDAERRYQEAEVRDAPSAERLARLGDAAQLRGDAAAASARYAAALALNPRSAPAERGLAQLARERGDLQEALEHAERAARFQMREWTYRRDLALIHQELGQAQQGLEEARAARRLAPAWEWNALRMLIESLRT